MGAPVVSETRKYGLISRSFGRTRRLVCLLLSRVCMTRWLSFVRTHTVSRIPRERPAPTRPATHASGVALALPRLRGFVTSARHTRTVAGAALMKRSCARLGIFAMVLCVSLLHGVAHGGPLTARVGPQLTHVRPTTASLARALEAGLERSELMRQLTERLEVSDVVVYITEEPLLPSRWNGYLSFQSASGGQRYLLVHVPSYRPQIELISVIGHELQHAVEIAEAPAVTDSRSLARHYQQVGFDVTLDRSGSRFESRGAIDAGQRVRRDVNSWRREMPREHPRGESVVLE